MRRKAEIIGKQRFLQLRKGLSHTETQRHGEGLKSGETAVPLKSGKNNFTAEDAHLRFSNYDVASKVTQRKTNQLRG